MSGAMLEPVPRQLLSCSQSAVPFDYVFLALPIARESHRPGRLIGTSRVWLQGMSDAPSRIPEPDSGNLHDSPDEKARREQHPEDAVQESEAIVENESRRGHRMPPLREPYGGRPDERSRP